MDVTKAINKDDILSALGLQTKRSMGAQILPVSSALAIGAAVGVCVGLLVAPRTGKEMRRQIKEKLPSMNGSHDKHSNSDDYDRSENNPVSQAV